MLMKVAIIGASGMIGSEVIKLALADNSVSSIVSFVRKPTGVSHPKLKEVLLNDMLDYSNHSSELSGVTAAICCVGYHQ